jgi:hypothetical protein
MKYIKLFEEFANEKTISIDWNDDENSLIFSDAGLIKVDYDGEFKYRNKWFSTAEHEGPEDLIKDLTNAFKGDKFVYVNEGLSKSEIDQIEKYLDKYVDEDALFDMCNDFYVEDEEWQDVKNDLDKSDLMQWALSYIKSNNLKLKDIKSVFEKYDYPEGVKTTGDKILDKFAKLIHTSSATVKIMSSAVQGLSVPFMNGPQTFSVTGNPSEDTYAIRTSKGVFRLKKNEIKKAEELYDEVESLVQAGKSKRSIEESVINEAKELSRDEMMKVMHTKYGLNFVKKSEEFDGEEGGIWLGGSDSLMPNAKDEMFNYYHGGSKYPQGVHKDLAKFLDKCGWYGQFADPGTVMLWPKN